MSPSPVDTTPQRFPPRFKLKPYARSQSTTSEERKPVPQSSKPIEPKVTPTVPKCASCRGCHGKGPFLPLLRHRLRRIVSDSHEKCVKPNDGEVCERCHKRGEPCVYRDRCVALVTSNELSLIFIPGKSISEKVISNEGVTFSFCFASLVS
jgi:hypothetical protein